VVIKGKTLWQIDLGIVQRDGRPHRARKTFAERKEAETFSALKRVERENYGSTSVSMPELLRGQAIEAARLLGPYDVSLLDVVRQYVHRREAAAKSETTPKAFESFLNAKIGDGLRARYTGDLRSRLRPFAESFKDRKVADIESAEIDRYLRELGVEPLTRNTVRQRLSVFFEYCRQRGWVQTNPIVDVSKAKAPPTMPGILTVEQAGRLLELASEKTLPFFAIGLFAGLRSVEIERLEWRHIRFDEKLIEVPALVSKTASRRFATIQPSLAAWLEPYRGCCGKVCPGNLYRRLEADRKAAGIVDWPSNALRHSFASYHLATFKNAPALSLEMGHVRPQTVFAHYRELVRPSDAERFWKIAPLIDAERKLAVVA
jgi:integrase